MNRRTFIRTTGVVGVAAIVLPACGGLSTRADHNGDIGEDDDLLNERVVRPTPPCAESPENPLGPFYRANAPFRAKLVDPGMTGTRLALSGFVVRAGTVCEPLADATLDFWQADADGAYDNRGFKLRGKVRTNAEGKFKLSTIVPGHYLNGDEFRPAHLHVIVEKAGFESLTTQLYFPEDPYNANDPMFDSKLLTKVSAGRNGKIASFDFGLV